MGDALERALALDADDSLARFRGEFHRPRRADGSEELYFTNNSLGLMPKRAREYVMDELDAWAQRGHAARFTGAHPWYSYHENVREPGARLVGAMPDEVVYMNALTVNLHLLLVSFYRPTAERFRIVTDHPTFPSDNHVVESQLRHHGIDPAVGHVRLRPRDGEDAIRTEDVEAWLAEHGAGVAVMLFSGVNFVTGQAHDIARITAAAHRAGAIAGWDLAHAVGNVGMRLHDWNVDFAAWCTYKYLCAGPGGPGGAFVHQRHGANATLNRFAGWWGQDPVERLAMDAEAPFVPAAGADGWQLSNPAIFSMAPLRAALELYDEATMPAFRSKSLRLTGFLEELVHDFGDARLRVVTPVEPNARGCQLSIAAAGNARAWHAALEEAGLVCDFRAPNVIRLAPHPLVNGYAEVARAAEVLRGQLHHL